MNTKRLTLSVALSAMLGLSFTSAFAAPSDGQTALNAKLAVFAGSDTTLPGKTPAAAKTTVTAKAADLLLAISDVLDDPSNTVSAADVAAGALQASLGKARGDKDKIAGQILDAVVASKGIANDSAQVAAVLAALFNANTDNQPDVFLKTELGAKGRAAALAAALKYVDATGGDDLATALNAALGSAVNTQNLVRDALIIAGSKNSAGVRGLVDTLFTNNKIAASGTDRAAVVQPIAAKVAAKNSIGAGALYGAAAANLTDTEVETLAKNAVNDSKLAKAIDGIVAATAAESGASTATFAANVAAALTKKTDLNLGLVAAGAVRAGSTASTAAIIAGIAGVVDKVKFGTAAATNIDNSAKLQAVANSLADSTNALKLGQSMLKTAAATNSSTAGGIVAGLLTKSGAVVGDKNLFTATVISTIKSNNAAVGSVASALAQNNGLAISVANNQAIATTLIPKASKAATSITSSLSSLLGSATDRQSFASGLATAVPKSAQDIIVGAAIADPSNADTITKAIIGNASLGLGKKADKIVQAVATAIDIEQAAEVAKSVGELVGAKTDTTAIIKASDVAKIAKALVKAINTKPGVRIKTNTLAGNTNPVSAAKGDEIGEVTAELVKAVLGKGVGSTDAAKLKDEQGMVLAIVKAAIGGLSKKALIGTATLPTDQEIAAGLSSKAGVSKLIADQEEAADIIGSVALVIKNRVAVAYAPESAYFAQTTGFLDAKVSKTALANYQSGVLSAINNIRTNTNTGQYEVGSVVDPETDTRGQ